jgi:hypothetical protein
MTQLPEGLPELPELPPYVTESFSLTDEDIQQLQKWGRAYGLACYQAGLERAAGIAADECTKQMQMGHENGGEWDRAVWACNRAVQEAIQTEIGSSKAEG